MAHLSFRELRHNEPFEAITLFRGAPFTQAGFYGEWQKNLGRKVRKFFVEREGKPVAYCQLVSYPLFGGKNYLYSPYGPIAKEQSEELYALLAKELERIAKEEQAVFVRMDFSPSPEEKLASHFFTKASRATYRGSYFQPRTEWVLPLAKPEYDLLSAMHKHTRYSIRLAADRSVRAEIVTENFERYFDAFYTLMQGTAARNRFNLHQKKYYEGIFRTLSAVHGSYLSIARFEEKILAINLIIVYGNMAMHVFGGSSSEERERQPAYAAQWKAICHAKEIGCTVYNFGGVSSEADQHPGWAGLTAFKKKFGGHELAHAEFFDVVAEPLWYWLYVFRKILRR